MFKLGSTVDNLLNSITMYRLLLYALCALAAVTLVFSLFNLVPYSPISQVSSLFVLIASCVFFNVFFSKLFNAPTNSESVYITAIILFFVLLPPSNPTEAGFLVLASLLAMGSKYILAYHKKHIFNPAAISAVILTVAGIGLSLWWIGNPYLLPFTLVIVLLIVRKIRKFKLFLTFLLTATLTASAFAVIREVPASEVISLMYLSGPIIFFAGIMLTEPSTVPPTAKKQLIYAVLVGLLYGTPYKFGPFFSSPELALVIGNIYSFAVSYREKLMLTLASQKLIARDTYEFVFKKPARFAQVPGQYFEWTLPHKRADSRGVRRYFTIASSPTEPEIKLGIKMNPNGSSFKKKLLTLKEGDRIMAGQLAGDFLLPKDPHAKLAFIAGGIGITPFRSMIENLIGLDRKLDIVMFYNNKTEDEIAYKNIFDSAVKNGVKTVYVLSDRETLPKGWMGESGHIDEAMLKKYVPDFKERTFYLSGPNSMVHAYKDLLVKMGVIRIVTDYFPGF